MVFDYFHACPRASRTSSEQKKGIQKLKNMKQQSLEESFKSTFDLEHLNPSFRKLVKPMN